MMASNEIYLPTIFPKGLPVEWPWSFDGSEPLQWIDRIERFFCRFGTIDPYRLKIAAIYFDGPVVPWFQELQQSGSVSSWVSLKNAILMAANEGAFRLQPHKDVVLEDTQEFTCQLSKFQVEEVALGVFDELPKREVPVDIPDNYDPAAHLMLFAPKMLLYAVVAEFATVRHRLEVLENILDETVQPVEEREGVRMVSKMMQNGGIQLNGSTLSAGFNASTICLNLRFGGQLHGKEIKLQSLSDLLVGSSLIAFYSKCEDLELAEKLFVGWPQLSVVSWNALLNRYAHVCDEKIVVSPHSQLTDLESRLNKHTLCIILKCCSRSGGARHGGAGQSLIIKIGLDTHENLGCALVDMYSKYGLVENAYMIIARIKAHDVVVWSALISCLDQQDFGVEAIELFENLNHMGLKPNQFTLLTIASVTSLTASDKFSASFIGVDGGIKPYVTFFSVDRFEDIGPNERIKKGSFFNWFYFFIYIGAPTSNSWLVWVQDNCYLGLGFGFPTLFMDIAMESFLCGTALYRFQKLGGSPLLRVCQVVVEFVSKWNVPMPIDCSILHELQISTIEGNLNIEHSVDLKFLDKAVTLSDSVVKKENFTNPWRMCTVTIEEELKTRGMVIGTTKEIVIPIARKFTGKKKVFLELQNTGVDLFISILSRVAVTLIEIRCLQIAIENIDGFKLLPISNIMLIEIHNATFVVHVKIFGSDFGVSVGFLLEKDRQEYGYSARFLKLFQQEYGFKLHDRIFFFL